MEFTSIYPMAASTISKMSAQLVQMCKLGWGIIRRMFFAYFIPWLVLSFACHDYFLHDTPWSVGVRLVLGFFLVVVYSPVAIYSAASRAGFCPAPHLTQSS